MPIRDGSYLGFLFRCYSDPVQIVFVTYALAQLLVLKGGEHLAALTQLAPWRQDRPVTAGLGSASPCSGF